MIQDYLNGSFSDSDHEYKMFKRSGISDYKSILESELNYDKETERENIILCKFCNNIITSPKNLIEIDGKKNHTFSNPAGNTYRIACFKFAEGCTTFGEFTIEYTWFSGYQWCYALCSFCHSHLGWFYLSGENSFYGLILNHLLENI